MFRDPSIAGDWPALVARLDAACVLVRWGAAEPVLAGVSGLAELPRCVAAGTDRDRADDVLGALVRLAAADGSDDPDAVLVLLHLLSDGAYAMAARLRDLSDDILTLVVGELTAQIRSFPWRRRTRAYAANLLLDTKAALWRELRPARTRAGSVGNDILVDPLDSWQVQQLLDRAVPGPGEPEIRLVDVLVWAARRGIAPVEDLALLGELAQRHDQPAIASQKQLAQQRRINERTLRRRRDRTLAALQAARSDYLLAVA
jgi:hypothetical protein